MGKSILFELARVPESTVVFCNCLRQLVAGDSDQIERLRSFGHCAQDEISVCPVVGLFRLLLLRR